MAARARLRLRLGHPGDRRGAARRARRSTRSTSIRRRSRRRAPTRAPTASRSHAGAARAGATARYALVLANILATPLKLLAPLLCGARRRRRRPGARRHPRAPGRRAAQRLRAVAALAVGDERRRLDPDDGARRATRAAWHDSAMSLATRCTACGTVFRVVQDQLKVSEGWVRCGRCDEVFNALEGLVRSRPRCHAAQPQPDRPPDLPCRHHRPARRQAGACRWTPAACGQAPISGVEPFTPLRERGARTRRHRRRVADVEPVRGRRNAKQPLTIRADGPATDGRRRLTTTSPMPASTRRCLPTDAAADDHGGRCSRPTRCTRPSRADDALPAPARRRAS